MDPDYAPDFKKRRIYSCLYPLRFPINLLPSLTMIKLRNGYTLTLILKKVVLWFYQRPPRRRPKNLRNRKPPRRDRRRRQKQRKILRNRMNGSDDFFQWISERIVVIFFIVFIFFIFFVIIVNAIFVIFIFFSMWKILFIISIKISVTDNSNERTASFVISLLAVVIDLITPSTRLQILHSGEDQGFFLGGGAPLRNDVTDR